MKNRQFNKKGFTLVEIIVSIAIFSAVLAVLGSVMVSGFKYFYETSNTDLDKRSIDQLSSYVREQLLYATDVKIQNSKPEGKWYSISVVDNKLHHYDQDEIDLNAFNNDSYYNGHSFKMTVKAYENNRLDLSYSMLDGTEALYTTRDTLELMNVTSIENAPFADEKIVGQDDLKIYYKKDKTAINNSSGGVVDESDGDRTVQDRLKLINWKNNRGYFVKDRHYAPGDYVYYDGSWWYSAANNDGNILPTEGNWIKLNKNFQTDSIYTQGDVIIYENEYYEYQFTWFAKGSSDCIPDPNPGPYSSNGWKKTTKEKLEADEKIYINKYEGKFDTVMSKLPGDVLPNDPLKKSSSIASGYDSNKKYSIGDLIKIEFIDDTLPEEKKKTGYYQVYIKIFNGNGKAPGVSNLSGWELLENDYSPKSSYVVGDYTIGRGGLEEWGTERFTYYRCIRDILTRESYESFINTYQDKTYTIEMVSQKIENLGQDAPPGDVSAGFLEMVK